MINLQHLHIYNSRQCTLTEYWKPRGSCLTFDYFRQTRSVIHYGMFHLLQLDSVNKGKVMSQTRGMGKKVDTNSSNINRFNYNENVVLWSMAAGKSSIYVVSNVAFSARGHLRGWIVGNSGRARCPSRCQIDYNSLSVQTGAEIYQKWKRMMNKAKNQKLTPTSIELILRIVRKGVTNSVSLSTIEFMEATYNESLRYPPWTFPYFLLDKRKYEIRSPLCGFVIGLMDCAIDKEYGQVSN